MSQKVFVWQFVWKDSFRSREDQRSYAIFPGPTLYLQGKMKNIERFKQEIAIMKMMDAWRDGEKTDLKIRDRFIW